MTLSSIRHLRRLLIPVGLLLVMLIAGSSIALGGSMVSTTAITPQIPGVTPLLSYQGRLVTPGTGAPKPDGTYEMSFRLYTVATGGTAIWTGTRDIQVANGVFSVLLGEVTALNASHFNGQELWLGVKVGADAEATPRQHLAHVAYALFAENAALLNGQAASAFAPTAHAHSGADITTGTVADARIAPTLARDSEVFGLVTAADGTGSGLDADLLDGQDSAFYRNATNINAGTLADARVAATIARDSEVFGLVTGADGTGSGLDADLLDGLNSTSFATAVHNHDAAYINSAGPDAMTGSNASPILSITQSGEGNGLTASTASTTIGRAGVSGVAGASGTTMNSYSGVLGDSKLGRGVAGVSGTSDGVIGFSTSGTGVNGQSIDGYGVSAFSSTNAAIHAYGDIEADSLQYNTPRTHYLSISGDNFRPRSINSGTSFFSAGSTAGSYFLAANTADDDLLAPLNLPDGATITKFEAHFYDNGALDLAASIMKHGTDGGYLTTALGNVTSSGLAGAGSRSAVVSDVVNNRTTFYEIYVRPTSGKWESVAANLRIIGVTITYTLSEAP